MRTIITEAAKRHEIQLRFLREGFLQDEARSIAADLPANRLDEFLETTKNVRFPERQIVPPGTIDLEDVKIRREHTLIDAEESEYFEKREQLTALMGQLFNVHELPLAGVQALLDAMEAGGISRRAAISTIIETVENLQRWVLLGVVGRPTHD